MQKSLNYLLSITKLDRSVKLYILAFATIGFIFVGIQGVLTNLYLVGLGLDLKFLGNLTASGMLVWGLFSLPAGMIGTRFGTRAATIVGFVLVSVFFILYLCVAYLPHSLWETGFYVTNMAIWIAASLVTVNGTPYLMAIAPENERNVAFTLGGALNAVTGFAGSLVAGFLPGFLMRISNGSLSQVGAFNIVLWITVPAYLGSAVLLFKARSAPPMELQETRTETNNRAPWGLLVFLGILFILQLLSENFVNVFINVYFAEALLVTTARIGIIFAVVRLLPFFISPLLPLALNRWGSGWVMTGGYVLMILFLLIMALFPTWQAAAASFILISLVTSLTVTARTIFSQEAVQPRWRTTTSAVLTICMAVATGVAGIAGGRIIPIFGFSLMFFMGAVFAMLAVLQYIAWIFFSTRRLQLGEPESIPIVDELEIS
jgi:MFS family permease